MTTSLKFNEVILELEKALPKPKRDLISKLVEAHQDVVKEHITVALATPRRNPGVSVAFAERREAQLYRITSRDGASFEIKGMTELMKFTKMTQKYIGIKLSNGVGRFAVRKHDEEGRIEVFDIVRL